MNFSKLKLLLFFLFVFQNNFAQYTDIINSNRPSESQSAFAVGRTVIQLEAGLGSINEKNTDLNYKANGLLGDFSLRYGFLKEELEFILDISYQRDTQVFETIESQRSSLKNSTLGLKYLIYDPFKYREEYVNLYSWKANNKFKWNQLIPIVAGYGGMNLNFSRNQFLPTNEKLEIISPKLMLITQQIFPRQYVFITNLYVDKLLTEGQSMNYLLTLTKGFNEKWSAFVEHKGVKNKFASDLLISTGGAYLFHSNWQVDASVGKNFKSTPSTFYAGVGISWRSDTNYKDVMIKTPGKYHDDKQNKSKKVKDKDLLKKKPKIEE